MGNYCDCCRENKQTEERNCSSTLILPNDTTVFCQQHNIDVDINTTLTEEPLPSRVLATARGLLNTSTTDHWGAARSAVNAQQPCHLISTPDVSMVTQANHKKKPSEKLLALHQLPGQLLTDQDLECEHWYDGFPDWPETSRGGPRGTIAQWSEIAESALSSASRMYEKRTSTSSGDAAKRALGKEKTIGDKIATLTLLVKESPVHRLDELRNLLSFAQKKSRRERSPAVEALKDLLLNDLLPNDRRLIFFHNRQFACGKSNISKRHVLYAMFESELKTVYREFLEALEDGGNDALPFFKQKMVKVIYELLVAKPEMENALLAMLVNKLGDPDKKVSSTASHSLLQLIEKHHPQMRLVVVKEVERLLARPHITPRTQYYSVCFLNQIRFTSADADFARNFVRVYMDLFTVCLQGQEKSTQEFNKVTIKKNFKRATKSKRVKDKHGARQKEKVSLETRDTKLMGAILVGVNRAFPYTKPEEDDSCYEKYYDSLFEVAHAKSLEPSTNALAFLFQVSQRNSTQNDRFYRALYSRIYDAADAGETTQAAFLNLVYRALKLDPNLKRVKAFMKRLLQAACYSTPGFAGACVMVVSEVFGTGKTGTLKSFVSLAEKDDQDEEFVDVDGIPSTGKISGAPNPSTSGVKQSASSLLTDSQQNGVGQKDGTQTEVRSSGQFANPKGYDPNKRDPQHAGAERSALWEAVTLTCHFHPSLSLFANTICTDMKVVSYTGDPLKDFSQISFLDRFSYKKAKNRVAKSLYGKRSLRYRDGPMANTGEFQELIEAGGVAQDDLFLARFFSNNPDRVVHENTGGSALFGKTSETDSEEDAFEEAMKAEMRRLGGGGVLETEDFRDFGGDIDEPDADEIRAFEKAFENEMVGSEVESDTHPGGEEDDQSRDIAEADNSLDRDTTHTSRDISNTDSTEKPTAGLFAPAEDYAEAIEMEMSRAEHFNISSGNRVKKKRNRADVTSSQEHEFSHNSSTGKFNREILLAKGDAPMDSLQSTVSKIPAKRRRLGKGRAKALAGGKTSSGNNVTRTRKK